MAAADTSKLLPNAPKLINQSVDSFYGSSIDLRDADLATTATWTAFTTNGSYRSTILQDMLPTVPDYLRPTVVALRFDVLPTKQAVVVRLQFGKPMSLERATILASALADAVGRRLCGEFEQLFGFGFCLA
jgi:hypothetical protein